MAKKELNHKANINIKKKCAESLYLQMCYHQKSFFDKVY